MTLARALPLALGVSSGLAFFSEAGGEEWPFRRRLLTAELPEELLLELLLLLELGIAQHVEEKKKLV